MANLDSFILANPRFIAIVDTNAILSSVDNDCRNGWTSRLLRIGEAGTGRLYAAEHVYTEVYRRLPKVSAASGITIDILQRHFEEAYLPLLRFVQVDTSAPRDPQVAAVSDETDLPTAMLAKLLAPSVVFSADKHLRRPGIAPEDWHAIAKAAISVVEGDEALAGTAMLIVLPPGLTYVALNGIARMLGLPTWLLVVAVVIVIVLVVLKAERRDALRRWVAPLAQEFLEVLSQTQAQKADGLRLLASAMLQSSERTLDSAIATVLANAREPLLAREVRAEIESRVGSEEVPAIGAVRAALRANPAFVPAGTYRWQLGHRRGPLVDVTEQCPSSLLITDHGDHGE